jgi:nucleoside-diphosphate-sugar epimerase
VRIAVIGASGVAGSALVRRAAKHTLRTDRVDIFDVNALKSFVSDCDAVVNLATRIGKWEENDRIRREGTANVIAASAGKIVVQQSIAMLHCADDSRPQSEDDPIISYGVLESAYDMEMLVRSSDLDWRIIRGAWFYGPGTNFQRPAEGESWMSVIHVDDFADAVLTTLERGKPREAYIACEDRALRVAPSRIRSFRVANGKLRTLGWSPSHSFADGPI